MEKMIYSKSVLINTDIEKAWYLATVGINLETFLPETLEFGGVVFEPVLRATWDIAWMARIALYVVGLTLLAALYPAIKAGRITPVEGMRHK